MCMKSSPRNKGGHFSQRAEGRAAGGLDHRPPRRLFGVVQTLFYKLKETTKVI